MTPTDVNPAEALRERRPLLREHFCIRVWGANIWRSQCGENVPVFVQDLNQSALEMVEMGRDVETLRLLQGEESRGPRGRTVSGAGPRRPWEHAT